MIQRTKLLLVKQLNISPGLLTPDTLPVTLDYRCIQNSQAPGTQSHQLPPISGSLSFCDPTTCFKNDYSKQNTHQSHLSFWAAHEPIPIFSLGHTKHWEGSSHKPLQPVLWFIRRKKKNLHLRSFQVFPQNPQWSLTSTLPTPPLHA